MRSNEEISAKIAECNEAFEMAKNAIGGIDDAEHNMDCLMAMNAATVSKLVCEWVISTEA